MRSWYYRASFGALVALAIIGGPAIFNACSSGSDTADKSGQVANLVVTPGSNQNTLKWDKESGAKSYTIHWTLNNPGSAASGRSFIQSAATGCDTATISVIGSYYIHRGLLPGGEYVYWVTTDSGDVPCGIAPAGSGVPSAAGTCENPDQSLCGGQCVYLSTDDGNCGACGNACPSGQICAGDGTCASGSDGTCNPGFPVSCTSDVLPFYCIDPDNDSRNCGSCGNACASGERCYNGTCLNFDPCTTAEGTWCGGTCTDLLISEDNCGACGTACDFATELCINGTCSPWDACAAADGTTCGSVCTDLNIDENNCGACGVTCASSELCISGACTPWDPCEAAGGTSCSGVCTDLNGDENNCGACGVRCAASELCMYGICKFFDPCAIMPGWTNCGTASNGVCVNLQVDNNNCGACGVVCTLPLSCSAGVCV